VESPGWCSNLVENGSSVTPQVSNNRTVFKVAKGIVENKHQEPWPQLCWELRRSLFTTNLVDFSLICVVMKCLILKRITRTCNVSHGENANFEPVFEPVLGP